jgi:uncharacterized repeat protein (TIGR03803 family)
MNRGSSSSNIRSKAAIWASPARNKRFLVRFFKREPLACLFCFVFVAAQASSLTTLYSFKGLADGGYPNALMYQAGTLYGTTVEFGKVGEGTVFALDPVTGAERVIYSFRAGADGAFPSAAVTFNQGMLYGTTFFGAGYGCFGLGCGMVFAVDGATGRERHLLSFAAGARGASPESTLVYFDGKLYGTASAGGSGCLVGCGVVFRIDPATRAVRILHEFSGGAGGSAPVGGLVRVDGRLYGTAAAGGGANRGTVFEINPESGKLKTLYSFAGGSDGAEPKAALTYLGGALYGTTTMGGAAGLGTVFGVNVTTGAETVLYSFGVQTGEGATPSSGVIYVDGALYGETGAGGAYGGGTLFSVDPRNGHERLLISFPGTGAGSGPSGGLIFHDGVFYGATCCSDFGTVFKWRR